MVVDSDEEKDEEEGTGDDLDADEGALTSAATSAPVDADAANATTSSIVQGMYLEGVSKVVVFSFFTTMLDMVEKAIHATPVPVTVPSAAPGSSGSGAAAATTKAAGGAGVAAELDSSSEEDVQVDGVEVEVSSDSGSDTDMVRPRTSTATARGIPTRTSRIGYARLDGTMSQKEREQHLENFRTKPGVTVLLMSLKAGGLGLNLTEANICVLLEPWWNSFIEQQALSRVHRMGQTKQVYVKRFIALNTIEESILEVQRRKQALADSALTSGRDMKDGNKLSEEELRMFFTR